MKLLILTALAIIAAIWCSVAIEELRHRRRIREFDRNRSLLGMDHG